LSRKLSGVRTVLRTVEMRPEEERRGLASQRSLAVGDAAWSEGNDSGGWRSGVVVGSSRRGVVVLSGTVLRVWSRWSERDWSGGPW
jgi:hypothetical protein